MFSSTLSVVRALAKCGIAFQPVSKRWSVIGAAVIILGVIGSAQAQYPMPPRIVPHGYRPPMYMPYVPPTHLPNHQVPNLHHPHHETPNLHHPHHELPSKPLAQKKPQLGQPSATTSKPARVAPKVPAKKPAAEATLAVKKEPAGKPAPAPTGVAVSVGKKLPAGNPIKAPPVGATPATQIRPMPNPIALPTPDFGAFGMPDMRRNMDFDAQLAAALDAFLLDWWAGILGDLEE